MGESWELLAHLREQQSYCNAAFMTFQNITLREGLCFGDLIVFQVGVKSFQQVSPGSAPTPKTFSGRGGREKAGSPSASSSTRTINSNRPGAGAAHAGARERLGQLGLLGAPGGRGSVVWPLLAGGSSALPNREPRRV